MSNPLLDIEPKELKFIFELKKQSSCTVQLTNNTYQYVAFKVKTTSPKKYSVRPNVGVLNPKSSHNFIVTMQAQKVAPADLMCKDKFLILSTTVPVETTDEDVSSSMFVKDGSRYIEENKLKVVLISTPHSPELSPIDGTFNKGIAHEKHQIFSRDEIFSSEDMVVKGAEHKMADDELKHEEEMELKPEGVAFQVVKDAEQKMANEELQHEEEMEMKPGQAVAFQVVEDAKQKMANEELKHEEEMELKPEDVAFQVVKDAEQKMANKELQHEEEMELKSGQAVAFQVVKNAKQKMANEELKHEEEMELKPEQAIAFHVVKDTEHKMVNGELKHAREMDLKPEQDLVLNTVKHFEELKPENDVGLTTVKDVEELKPEKKAELEVSKRVEELKLTEVIEEMNLKLNEFDSKLNEAGMTISKLTEERRLCNQEIRILQEKLADLSKLGVRKVQVGFPLLYVCMVAIISVFLGYRLQC